MHRSSLLHVLETASVFKNMEETTSWIYRGCKLARELEANMPNLGSQPDVLSRKCDEIIRVFSNVKGRLQAPQCGGGLGGLMRQVEWPPEHIHSGGTTAMGLHRQLGETSATDVLDLPAAHDGDHHHQNMMMMMMTTTRDNNATMVPAEMRGSSDDNVSFQGYMMLQPATSIHASDDSSRPSTSSQRPRRRRKDEVDKRTTRVAAPQMGNTEVPPDDGYTWRKYGQKEILGSRFPRAYYRCTHQKLYDCKAKKQVQRVNEEPSIFEVTYIAHHTCHLSSTAPSTNPVLMPTSTTAATTSHQDHLLPPASIIMPWLSAIIPSSDQQGEAASAANTTNSNNMVGVVDYHHQQQLLPVADMADAMFNSGSSSNNSIDLIFHTTMEDWNSNNNAGGGDI